VNAGLVGLYAIYLILIGVKGNSEKAYKLINRDGKGFLVWIVTIIILRSLYGVQKLRPLATTLIALSLLTFTLLNYDRVISQLNKITGLNIPTGKKP